MMINQKENIFMNYIENDIITLSSLGFESKKYKDLQELLSIN